MDTWAAFLTGIIGSFVYCGSTRMMAALKIDDPLEASQVHGFCGIWGCLAIAFFGRVPPSSASETYTGIGIFYGAEGSGKLLGY